MRKIVIWYLKMKLNDIKHEMESLEINQDVIEEVEYIYNCLLEDAKAIRKTIGILKSEQGR